MLKTTHSFTTSALAQRFNPECRHVSVCGALKKYMSTLYVFAMVMNGCEPLLYLCIITAT